MESLQEVIDLNSRVAKDATTQKPFPRYAAEMLLLNIAMAADRLSPDAFVGLSTEALSNLGDLVMIAVEVSPLPEEDQLQQPGEATEKYNHRVGVQEPLVSLKNYVAKGKYDITNEAQMNQMRRALHLAGRAFKLVVTDAAENHAIQSKKEDFKENATLAAKNLGLL